MPATVIVSVSGIRNSTLDETMTLVDELDTRGAKLSLLVAPRRGGDYRLADDSTSQQWLQSRRDRGDAIVLGGYDEAATKRRRPEFAAIGKSECAVRLAAADRLMADLGLRTRLFAPPRWNASPGCVAALPEAGFRICADLVGIRDVIRGTVTRGRVLSIGEGFLSDAWWCRAMVAAAERTASSGGVVRLNVSAKQLARKAPRSAILDAYDSVVAKHGALSAQYSWVKKPVANAA